VCVCVCVCVCICGDRCGWAVMIDAQSPSGTPSSKQCPQWESSVGIDGKPISEEAARHRQTFRFRFIKDFLASMPYVQQKKSCPILWLKIASPCPPDTMFLGPLGVGRETLYHNSTSHISLCMSHGTLTESCQSCTHT